MRVGELVCNITYVNGDILTPADTNAGTGTIVCHQVNCKGVMGAGLALQIKKRFPHVFEAYRKDCLWKLKGLGDIQIVSCISDAGYLICNCFGQDGYGRDKCYTDYDALRKCFYMLHETFPDDVIRIPYLMGCGLAGGDWVTVLRIIREELSDKGQKVEVWKLG